MRLSELEPEFLKIVNEKEYRRTDSIQNADGIWFQCPKCFGGSKGTHMVICWNPSVPQTIGPMPGRWNMEGTGHHDLSLVAGSSSVLLQGGCNAHFFIRKGEIQMA